MCLAPMRQAMTLDSWGVCRPFQPRLRARRCGTCQDRRSDCRAAEISDATSANRGRARCQYFLSLLWMLIDFRDENSRIAEAERLQVGNGAPDCFFLSVAQSHAKAACLGSLRLDNSGRKGTRSTSPSLNHWLLTAMGRLLSATP